MPMKTKLSTYAATVGRTVRSEARSTPCGGLSSRTMIVMITAMTPSLNASSRAGSVENGALAPLGLSGGIEKQYRRIPPAQQAEARSARAHESR
jgi:hypothetical protein